MNITLIADDSSSIAGLGTSTFTAPLARTYMVSVQSTMLPPSGLLIVINHNGSAVVTRPVLASNAKSNSAAASIVCAVNDTITVVLSSSVDNDALPQSVKSIISISTMNF